MSRNENTIHQAKSRLFNFNNVQQSLVTSARKRAFSQASPGDDSSVVSQLTAFSGNEQEIIDSVKGLISASPCSKLHCCTEIAGNEQDTAIEQLE